METCLELPFHLRGHAGMVVVAYGVNDNPSHWGFGFLDLPFDFSLVRGFPLLEAKITYGGPGYLALMGWIQVVTVIERSPANSWASVDVYPMHWETDTPFATFGHAPSLFDAPGPNPPRANEQWTAETFLAITPDGARTRRVVPLLGFRWGYELKDMQATLLALESVSAEVWHQCLGTLEPAYPSWIFASQFSHEDVLP